MVLEFYYDLKSQPCRAVYYLLKAAKVKFEGHKLDLTKGEHMKPEYLKINMFHKVPAIKDGSFTLTESVAILRYVAQKYNVSENWYPRKDVQKQARVDEFLNWHHTGLRKPCVDVVIAKMRSRMPFFSPSIVPLDAEKLKELQEGVKKVLNEIEKYYLKGKPFITGDEISVADLTGYCELMQLDSVEEEDLFKSNEAVYQWMKRVEAKVGQFTEVSAEQKSFREMYASGGK